MLILLFLFSIGQNCLYSSKELLNINVLIASIFALVLTAAWIISFQTKRALIILIIQAVGSLIYCYPAISSVLIGTNNYKYYFLLILVGVILFLTIYLGLRRIDQKYHEIENAQKFNFSKANGTINIDERTWNTNNELILKDPTYAKNQKSRYKKNWGIYFILGLLISKLTSYFFELSMIAFISSFIFNLFPIFMIDNISISLSKIKYMKILESKYFK
jgi:hypothetical protein